LNQMGIEWILIAAGVAILIAVLAQRRRLQKRLTDNREALAGIKFQDELPAEVGQVLKKTPRLQGDGTFKFKTLGGIPFANNFEAVRLARRIYFVDPTVVEVLLLPDPSNLERKLAVAVTLDSKVLGYVPTQEAGEMHKYLLAHSSGVRAMAKIYLGSRPEYNGVMLDFAKPLKLESKWKA
jgi:hypothetical protein